MTADELIHDSPRAPGERSPLAWLAVDRALRVLDGQDPGPLVCHDQARLGMLVHCVVKGFGREVLPHLTSALAIEGAFALLVSERHNGITTD